VPKVSAVVITKNEERRLADALASVAWADEILVIDSHSTDATVDIARRFTDRVIVRDWPGYIDQKNWGASAAQHEWVLSIDADERVTPELAREIRRVLEAEPPAAGFRIPRISFYLGHWIRSTDWYPDYQLRLYDRRRARWTGRHVHESVTVDGAVEYLKEHLQHLPYASIADHLARIDAYTTLAARQMADEGRRAGIIDLVAQPPAAFLRNYLLKGGIRQGHTGFVVSTLNSYYVFLKFAKLWERARSGER
jgi:glycosyltransferase involved in cell wall biosynthesis